MGITRRDFIQRSVAFGGGVLALTAAGRYFWISKDDQYYTFSSHALTYSSDQGYRSKVFIQGAGSWLARNGAVRDFPLRYKLFFANTEGQVVWTKEGIIPPITSLTVDIPPMGFGSVKVAFSCSKEQILEVQPEVGGFFVQETPFGSDGLHMAETRDKRGFARICGIYPPNENESLVVGFANTSMDDTNVIFRICDADGKVIDNKVIKIPKFGSHRFVAGSKLVDDPAASQLPVMAPGSPFIFHISNSADASISSHAWIANTKIPAFTTYHGSLEQKNLPAKAASPEDFASFDNDPMSEVVANKGYWCADIGADGEVAFANDHFKSAILMSNYTGGELETFHAILGFDGNIIAKTNEVVKIPKDGILFLPLDDKRFVWEPSAAKVGMVISHFGLKGRQSVAYAKIVTTTKTGRFMQHYRPNEHIKNRQKWLADIDEETNLKTDYWVSGCRIQKDTKNVVAVRSFSESLITDGEIQIVTEKGIQARVAVPKLPPYGAVMVSLDSVNGKIGDDLAAIRLVSGDGYVRHSVMVKVGDRNWTARHGTSRLQEPMKKA